MVRPGLRRQPKSLWAPLDLSQFLHHLTQLDDWGWAGLAETPGISGTLSGQHLTSPGECWSPSTKGDTPVESLTQQGH